MAQKTSQKKNKKVNQALQLKLKRINAIYADFRKEIAAIKKHEHQVINQALQEIDQQKIQTILDDIHQKHA